MLNPERLVITPPYHISVFGSAKLRIAPDIGVISFSVSELRPQTREAYQAVREASQKIQALLASMGIKDAGTSSIHLHESHRYNHNREEEFLGYTTNVDFRIILTDLTQVETVLIGLLDVGVKSIRAVNFQTTRLKEIRAEARRQAVIAAREKAEIYCNEAGVGLGDVLHIEDLNPDNLQRSGSSHAHTETPVDDDGEARAFDPSSIVVAGAVKIIYELQPRGTTTKRP